MTVHSIPPELLTRAAGAAFEAAGTDVAEAVEVSAPAGLALLALVATWAGDHDYGRQLDGQLRLADLPRAERADDADVVVLTGLAGEPEIERATASAPLPLVAFDGMQGAALGDREVRVAMPYAPVDGVPTRELLAGVERARHGADLVIRAAAEGAAERPAMLAALRQLGGFDIHGDPPAPAVWLWRADASWDLRPESSLL
jgi:hypothetical protein